MVQKQIFSKNVGRLTIVIIIIFLMTLVTVSLDLFRPRKPGQCLLYCSLLHGCATAD